MASIIVMELQLTQLRSSHNHLGILFDNKLKFHDHTAKVTTKANRILGMIKKSFDYLDSGMLSKLFTTLVRPILEYRNSIWARGPSRAGIPYKLFGIPRNLAQNLESCLGIWNLLID